MNTLTLYLGIANAFSLGDLLNRLLYALERIETYGIVFDETPPAEEDKFHKPLMLSFSLAHPVVSSSSNGGRVGLFSLP